MADSTFTALVQNHHAAVYRCASRVLGCSEDAADVTQQVFLRVCSGRTRLPGSAERDLGVLRWITVRLSRNRLRERRRRERHERSQAHMRSASIDDSDPLLEREQHDALQMALADLPDSLRLPVALRFQEGLSFNDLARSLACSKSTAHQLVSRGLDALRERLRGAGFAALAANVGDRLSELGPGAAPPAGLAEQIVQASEGARAATATATGLTGGKLLAIAGLSLVLAGGVGFAMVDDSGTAAAGVGRVAGAPADQDGPRRDVDSLPTRSLAAIPSDEEARTAPAARRSLVGVLTGTGEELQDGPTGTVRGSVTTPEGAPIADALVFVSSLEYGGKAPRASRKVRTDARGRYEIEVPVLRSDGQTYRSRAALEGYSTERSETFSVREGSEFDVAALQLRRLVDDRPGAWWQDVLVRDPLGRPVASADVRLERVTTQGEIAGGAEERRVAEFRGVTDETGNLRVEGSHLGEKRLVVRPAQGAEFSAAVVRFAQSVEGAQGPRVVSLEHGRRIAGVVRNAVDGQPLAGFSFEVLQQDLGQVGVRTDEFGRFERSGLFDLPVTLRAWSGTMSGFLVEGVPVDTLDLDLRVKRADDPRTQALSWGELHGEIVDAVTGEPVEVEEMQLRVHWLGDEPVSEATIRHEKLLGLLNPPPVQIMLPAGADAAGWVEPTCTEFHKTGIRAGHVLLMAWTGGYSVGWIGPFEVGPGIVHANLELRMSRGATASGTVVDAAGRPVAGATVWVGGRRSLERLPFSEGDGGEVSRAELASDLRRRRDPTWKTDASGRFTVDRLPPGSDLVIHAVAPDDSMGHGRVLTLRDRQHVELRSIVVDR